MAVLESLNSLLMIFIMILPGIFMARKNIITEDQSLGINSIVVNLTWPCLVIDAMQIPFSIEILKSCGYVLIIVIVIFIISYLISLGLTKLIKLDKSKSYLFTFMIIFANTGFMGIPVINALYGKDAIFYASIVEMINDVFLFTVGILLIQLSAGSKAQMNLKGLVTPGMVGVIIGFLLFLFNLQLPDFLGNSVQTIGSATTPLTMLLIGMQVGRMKLKELFGDVDTYILSFVKLLIVPGIAAVIMIIILGDTSLLAKVVILDFAMPTAACATIFTQQYRGDVAFAVKGVLASTILSILSLSIFAVVLSLI